MKRVRKVIIAFVALAILICAPVITASAKYEDSAQQLFDLGLFLGTDVGFELESTPTRAQAVTMLVRLLGLEEEAQNSDYSHPFTDVPDWASPYVALAYDWGYTTGVSDTLFDPDDLCSAQMYVTFILRALGYTDDDATGDTLWGEAIDFGKMAGVVDDALLEGTFQRGNMTAVSCMALAVPTADGRFNTLLDKLKADNAVDAEVASSLQDHFALLAEVAQAGAGLDEDMDFALSYSVNAETTTPLGTMQVYYEQTYITMVGEGDDRAAAYQQETGGLRGETFQEWYITDGYAFFDEFKCPADSPLALPLDHYRSLSAGTLFTDQMGLYLFNYPVYAIKTIAKDAQDGLTVYSVELSEEGANTFLAALLRVLDIDIDGAASESFDIEFYVDADSNMTRVRISANVIITIADTPTPIYIDTEVEVIATGSDVVIFFPDYLDEYIESDGEVWP